MSNLPLQDFYTSPTQESHHFRFWFLIFFVVVILIIGFFVFRTINKPSVDLSQQEKESIIEDSREILFEGERASLTAQEKEVIINNSRDILFSGERTSLSEDEKQKIIDSARDLRDNAN